MRITPKVLQEQWDSIDFKDGGFLQIDTTHPLEWHIGFQSISQKTLILVCNTKIENVESSKSMSVTLRRREIDNRWLLSFELLRDEQQGVFATFCCDMIDHSSTAKNETDALAHVIGRYKQWNRLLEAQKRTFLDDSNRKGLLGELLFLEMRLNTSDALSAIQGWLGPEGADQDFIYPDGWYEVKSVGSSKTSALISSLEQLTCDYEGELVVMRIDKTSPNSTKAQSLNDAVCRINKSLANSDDAKELFQSKLTKYGYMDLHEYSEPKYNLSAVQHYQVDASFPRLTRQMIPTQILSLHYELDLPSLADWQKE